MKTTIPIKRKYGFTLVELLVAVSVMAIIAMLGWRGLDVIIRARNSLTGELEKAHGVQLAFAQMESDCEHLISYSTLPNRAPLVVAQNRLVLVRNVFADNQPSRVQVVAYHLRDGVLSRRESAATRDLATLDALWQAEAADVANSRDVVLQTGVAGMGVRVWLSDGTGWRQPGIDVAPSGGATPTGLEVLLQVQGAARGMTKVFLLGAQ
ncbi:PulJ/GspJ family protein [Undibacterium sp. TJN25]|uniref:PulJ/GspJ family protein n=1 Tax=Undibacterium sp. TJN25 TaxID=3413056 RepID=UPI003BF2323B